MTWLTKRRAVALTLLLLTLLSLPFVAVVAKRLLERRAVGRQLRAELAALDRDDPIWRVGDVAAAHNAAIPADDAANATLVGLNALSLRPPSAKDRERALYAEPKIPDIEFDDDRLPHDDALCSLLDVHFESAAAHRAALSTRSLPAGGLRFRFADPDPFGTLLNGVQQCREVASLLKDYAAAESCLGQPDNGLAAAVTLAHFADVSLSTEPTLISQLVRNAMLAIACGMAKQALAWGEPDRELAAAQAEFLRAAAVDGLTPGLRGERAALMRIYENVANGALPGDHFETNGAAFGAPKPTGVEKLKNRLTRDLTRTQLDSLLAYNDYLAACKLPDGERQAAFAAVTARLDKKASSFLPVIDKCLTADSRTRARLLCVAVGLACERHRRATGHFPATLGDISKDILPEVPTDPFSGRPLGYRVFDDGAGVYTVGEEGTFTGVVDPEATGNNLDWMYVFRLWNTDARRRPPTPRPPEPEGFGPGDDPLLDGP